MISEKMLQFLIVKQRIDEIEFDYTSDKAHLLKCYYKKYNELIEELDKEILQ